MNRLLLLAFLLAMLAVATLGSREEEEEGSVARSARAAEPGRGGVRKGAKSNRCKRKCNNDRECIKKCRNRGRPSGKSLKTGVRKGAKSTRCKRKCNNDRACIKKCIKRGRPSGKSLKTARSRPSGKGENSSTTCSTTCLDTIAKYTKDLYNKIPNYMRQQKRIIKANKTGGTKNGKTAAFATAAQKIVQAGGGNMSALSCNGNTNSTGATKLLSMATSLKACAKSIDTACNPMNLPLPNMTEVDACVANMELFKTKVSACEASPNCTCYTDSAITDLKTAISPCKLADDNRVMSALLTSCKSNFTACKKMEDEGMQATHACSISTTSMVADAAALTANSAGLAAAQATTAGLTATNSTGRKTRAAVTTCAEVIATNTKILAAVAEMPTSSTIATLCATVTSVSVTCTAAEITSLTTQATSLTEAKATVDSNLASVQSTLETATGTTASSAAIAAASGGSSGATAASGNRRNIVARHLLNRLNLK